MISSLSADAVSLRGNQQPRISSVPRYASSTGAEAVALASIAGLDLDEWQRNVLVAGLGEAPVWKCSRCTYRSAVPVSCPDHQGDLLIHPWAAFEVALVIPRQNGKSELLVARMLAGLFILEEPLQIFTAHLFDTATEVFRRLEAVVEACDELRAEVKQRNGKLVGIKHGHGDEGIELKSGARVRFKARTGGGGRGFSCDCLYLDEAMILREQFLGSTIPTLSARANPQVWLAGSAPDEDDPVHDGVVLAKRRARALAGDDPSLAYFEHSAKGDHPDLVGPAVLDDEEQWALANPAKEIRISTEYIANERAAMGSRQFAVERLGIGAWPDITGDAGRVITDAMWTPLADVESRIGSNRVFSVDIDPDQAWATIAAAGVRGDGLIHVGVVDHRRGTDWVVGRLAELFADGKRAKLVVDPRSSVSALLPDFDEHRFPVVRMTPGDYAQACGGFFRAVSEKRLRYMPPQPELDQAVEVAKTRPLLDSWKWSRKDSGAVITPLIASTLAVWGAQQRPATPRFVSFNDL